MHGSIVLKVFAVTSSFALTAVVGCQLIVGNEDRTLDPPAVETPDGSSGDASGGNTDAAPDPDAGPCVTTCLVPADTCGNKCKTDESKCRTDCKKSPQACKTECEALRITCENTCIAACTACRDNLSCGGNASCGDAVRK